MSLNHRNFYPPLFSKEQSVKIQTSTKVQLISWYRFDIEKKKEKKHERV
jgi:hypothetical protein